MSRAPALSDRSTPAGEMGRRLEAFSRYATLVRWQEEALREGDLHRFQELMAAREAMQAGLDSAQAELPEPSHLDPGTLRQMREVEEELRQALELDAELRVRLSEMRSETREQIRSLDDRGGKVKRYLSEGEVGPRDGPARLNVRL